MKLTEQLGIGSWAYRYATGCHGFHPEHPLSIRRFAQNANELGFSCIQICENLNYAQKSNAELAEDAAYIKSLGLTVQLGMNGLSQQSLLRHIEICKIFDCKFLRVVVGGAFADSETLYQNNYTLICENLHHLEEAQIVLAIENHFDLTADQIVRMVREISSPYVRAVYDSTNSIGFLEEPMTTLKKMLPVAVSCHLKDYTVEKAEAGYRMRGTILGAGCFDVRQALECFWRETPKGTVILETSIPRDPNATNEDVLSAERQQIRDCTSRLQALAISIQDKQKSKGRGIT